MDAVLVPPFLMGSACEIQAPIFSFMAGVILSMAMLADDYCKSRANLLLVPGPQVLFQRNFASTIRRIVINPMDFWRE